MKRRCAALLLALLVGACSSASSPPATFGVDGAPELVRNTFLTVTRQAATLAGYDATNDQWLDFARSVCGADIKTSQQLSDFATQKAGPKTDPTLRQMWTTAATAAAAAFCPIGES